MNSLDMKTVLSAAVRAPSGDNLQPWRFRVGDGVISVFGIPKDPTLRIDCTNTLIACGAAIEHMVIAAHALGYDAKVSYVSTAPQDGRVADVAFSLRDEKTDQELYAAISQRVTNRKKFRKTPLSAEQVHELSESVQSIPGMRVQVVATRSVMRVMAHAFAVNILHFLEDKTIHDYLFGNIRWTKQERLATRDGMPIESLQVNPIERMELKLMRSWAVAKFFARLKAGKMAAEANADKFLAAGGFVTLLAPSDKPEDLVAGGRALARLWLAATVAGLSAQPIAGFVAGQGGDTVKGFEMLSPELSKETEQAYETIRKAVSAGHETIIITLRMGRAKLLRGRTLRKSLAEVNM